MDLFKDIAEKSFFYVVAHGEYNPILEKNIHIKGGAMSEIDESNIINLSNSGSTQLDTLLGIEGDEYIAQPYITGTYKDVHFNLKTPDHKARLQCNKI